MQFFCMISDVRLDSTSAMAGKIPPKLSNPILGDPQWGTTYFGCLQLTPLLALKGDDGDIL
jgi:hypothetical protein